MASILDNILWLLFFIALFFLIIWPRENEEETKYPYEREDQDD